MTEPALKIVPQQRPVDPNVIQRRASDPQKSVWVAASAGSGKTKILTDRLLRLLLPAGSKPPTPAERILALTFTKAGASEMTLRLNKILQKWAVTDLQTLEDDLRDILGQAPDQAQIRTARTLFSHIVDLPGGMKIMTIHSFCQSVLGRFPLEAGLNPNFQPLDEAQSKMLLEQAFHASLQKALQQPQSPLGEAYDRIARMRNEDQLMEILKGFVSERRKVEKLLQTHFDIQGFYAAFCQSLDIRPDMSVEDLLTDFFTSPDFPIDDLKSACAALAQGSEKTDQPLGDTLARFIELSPQERVSHYQIYKDCFIAPSTQSIRKTLMTKKIVEAHPDVFDALHTQAERVYALEQDIKSIQTALTTRDIFTIAQDVLETYIRNKQAQNALDFDDMIYRTLDLLEGRTMNTTTADASAWVMYKLDQGLDHILVDEAQDTNPEQWAIIRALTEEFFNDQSGQDDTNRTVFVVGDSKQSIFSFQRAAPEKFISMQDWFAQKIRNAGHNFETVDMNISFRSAPAILQAVDSVFNQDHIRQGLGPNILPHIAYRRRQASHVALWPLVEPIETDETVDPDNFWKPPIHVLDAPTPSMQLAQDITRQIKTWLKNKEILKSHNRPIHPGDILILVRTRNAFVDQLMRMLKKNNIPVSGADRMVLGDQICVQDLIAGAHFTLQPLDDLTLATFLKTPFIGLSEEDLYDLCYGREGSLYQSVRTQRPDIGAYLQKLIHQSRTTTPYGFFSALLDQACPQDPQSGLRAIYSRLGQDVFEPIEEFLNLALQYEQKSAPSLQGFLKWQSDTQSDIKRELEEAGGALRIMTVHASKGLQAPIVFLPDTTRTHAARKTPSILWPNTDQEAHPFFIPAQKDLPAPLQKRLQAHHALNDEEYRRLLYVAMTRAEDRLYICGYSTKTKPSPDSWYFYMKDGLEKCEDTQTDPQTGTLTLQTPCLGDPDKIKQAEFITDQATHAALPEWVSREKPTEDTPPRPLQPSRPTQADPQALSPAFGTKTEQKKRFQRGNMIHTLLQFLPGIDSHAREDRALKWLAQTRHTLSKEDQEDIKDEVLTILQDPAFAPVFASGSLAEVPITGMVDDTTLLSGRIDRLRVTDKEVFIIDYKTNRPPPETADAIPDIYIQQMDAYTRALTAIYPDKKIRRALLWTYGPRLMEI